MQFDKDYFEYYLAKLKNGEFDVAFHSLIDLGSTAIPQLVKSFELEQSPEIRAELVRIVWYFRNPDSVSFLGAALRDPNPVIWKSALDGLVAIGTSEALAELGKCLSLKREEDFQNFVSEAMDQIKSATE
jgi:hypothetical protein